MAAAPAWALGPALRLKNSCRGLPALNVAVPMRGQAAVSRLLAVSLPVEQIVRMPADAVRGAGAAVMDQVQGEQAVPVSVAAEPLARDPETKLYGVNREQVRAIVSILKRYFGEDLLDLAAIGSRAKGHASVLKKNRPVSQQSDLDLAPLLARRERSWPDSEAIAREIEADIRIRVQLHSVLGQGQSRYGDHVPFYGGGNETWEYFGTGEAVRMPLE